MPRSALRSPLPPGAIGLTVGLLLTTAGVAGAADCTEPAADAAAAPLVGAIDVEVAEIFDPQAPGEDARVFRFINRLHRRTSDRAIERLLLFDEGEPFSCRLLAESERVLRENRFLRDAHIVAGEPVRDAAGGPTRVPVHVATQDVWTLKLGLGLRRAGGSNSVHLGLADANFLGTGITVGLARRTDVDRTSNELRIYDPSVLGHHLRALVDYADTSDGSRSELVLERPFLARDARVGFGVRWHDEERVDSLYALGHVRERLAHRIREGELWLGLGRPFGQDAARRWEAGVTYVEDGVGATVAGETAVRQATLAVRRFVYPWIGLELVSDRLATQRNVDQIGRTEDVLDGWQARVRLGYSAPAFGASEQALMVDALARVGAMAGERRLQSAELRLTGRVDAAGGIENALGELALRQSWRDWGRHLLVATLTVDAAHRLDPGRQLLLGGDLGLRGYPLRYQEGELAVLASVEQRFFTEWDVLHLVRVGAAVFTDVGRTFGVAAAGGTQLGWLRDVGVGLRLAPTRTSSGSVVHVDLAVPLDGPAGIDRLQWLISTRASF